MFRRAVSPGRPLRGCWELPHGAALLHVRRAPGARRTCSSTAGASVGLLGGAGGRGRGQRSAPLGSLQGGCVLYACRQVAGVQSITLQVRVLGWWQAVPPPLRRLAVPPHCRLQFYF